MSTPRQPQPQLEVTLSDDPTEVGRARGISTDYLDKLGSRAPEVAVLLVSELVTNAIRYGRPPIILRAAAHGAGLRVEVMDNERRPPAAHSEAPISPGSGDIREGGRGLLLVQGLSDRWGWTPTGRGKVVWFELDVI